jgi:hypothetical protein
LPVNKKQSLSTWTQERKARVSWSHNTVSFFS